MFQQTNQFSLFSSTLYCSKSFSQLKEVTSINNTIIVVDKIVYGLYKKQLINWNVIILPFSGEKIKTQKVVDYLLQELIKKRADKTTCLVGVGGGTVTDLVGYAASIYMRGMKVGFIPTTLLAMVDAAIGGKNGINYNDYKNVIGTTYQPSFVLYDYDFLKTLPRQEWINGFAEIIKHACIKNATMLQLLGRHNIDFFKKNKKQLADLIQKNLLLKLKIVKKDEQDKKERQLLNFGHTIGHAIERIYKMSHGQAVSIGIAMDCAIAKKHFGFKEAKKVLQLLQQYELPIQIKYNKKELIQNIQMDKKKQQQKISYIFLEKIGKAYIKNIFMDDLIRWL